MRPSRRCCPSLSSGLAEMIRKYFVRWETSVTVKHLIKKVSLSGVVTFYKIDGEILKAEQKMYARFRRVRELSYMTVPEMLETMHENDPFDLFPLFSNVVHILGLIPPTLCSAERSFSMLHRLKTYLRSTMSKNVSVTSQLLTLKGHMPTP